MLDGNERRVMSRGIAAGVAMIVQIVLSVNRQEPFLKMLVVTDVIVAACVLFPVTLKRQMLWALIPGTDRCVWLGYYRR